MKSSSKQLHLVHENNKHWTVFSSHDKVKCINCLFPPVWFIEMLGSVTCSFWGADKRDHITLVCASLYWFPVHVWNEFKVLLFVFKALRWLTHSYIADMLCINTAFWPEGPKSGPRAKCGLQTNVNWSAAFLLRQIFILSFKN